MRRLAAPWSALAGLCIKKANARYLMWKSAPGAAFASWPVLSELSGRTRSPTSAILCEGHDAPTCVTTCPANALSTDFELASHRARARAARVAAQGGRK